MASRRRNGLGKPHRKSSASSPAGATSTNLSSGTSYLVSYDLSAEALWFLKNPADQPILSLHQRVFRQPRHTNARRTARNRIARPRAFPIAVGPWARLVRIAQPGSQQRARRNPLWRQRQLQSRLLRSDGIERVHGTQRSTRRKPLPAVSFSAAVRARERARFIRLEKRSDPSRIRTLSARRARRLRHSRRRAQGPRSC